MENRCHNQLVSSTFSEKRAIFPVIHWGNLLFVLLFLVRGNVNVLEVSTLPLIVDFVWKNIHFAHSRENESEGQNPCGCTHTHTRHYHTLFHGIGVVRVAFMMDACAWLHIISTTLKSSIILGRLFCNNLCLIYFRPIEIERERERYLSSESERWSPKWPRGVLGDQLLQVFLLEWTFGQT